MANSYMIKQAKGSSSKSGSRTAKTGQEVTNKKAASSASKKVIKQSAARHSAALTRLANR